MKWRGRRSSRHVEDRRGRGGRGVKAGGGVIVLVIVLALVTGENPLGLLQLLAGSSSTVGPSASRPASPEEDALAEFVGVVLADTESVWGELFSASGERYPEPTLVLYEDSVRSACGLGSSATGPFYCPGDQRLYLDLGFFRELKRLGAPGDFALAYVIGHEVGHHVQTVTGTTARVRTAQGSAGRDQANRLSVAMELQADCYAGLWAQHAQRRFNMLEPGDLEEALEAAAAIGDDRLQQRAGKVVRPESFTHGTSRQRVEWFRRGFDTGQISACDTFG